MAQTPACPHPSTALAAEVCALERELVRCGDQIDCERDEAASALVRAAREFVAQARAPVDRDVLALLRVAAACATTERVEAPDMADVAAALTLIAKTMAGRAGTGTDRPRAEAGLAHVQATLAQIAAGGATGAGDSPRSADMTPSDDV